MDVIRYNEEKMAKQYGSDWWLMSEDTMKLWKHGYKPQVGSEVFGFFADRVPPIGAIRDRIDEATAAAEKAQNMLEKVDRARNALAYKGTNPLDAEANIVARFEDLVAFITAITRSDDFFAQLAALHLYLRTFFHGSVVVTLLNQCVALLGFGNNTIIFDDVGRPQWSSQSGEEDYHQADDIFSFVKGALSDWKEFRHNSFSKKICDIINLLVCTGLIGDGEKFSLNCGMFNVYSVKARDVQLSAMSFFEMIVETCMFFIERGYKAFTTGDIGYLFGDDDAKRMDREYALLLSALPLLESGNLDKLSSFNEQIIDHSDYEVRLHKLISDITGMIKVEKHSLTRNTLTNRLVQLTKLRTSLILAQQNSCVRDKPFGLMIYGGSGVGKTMLNAAAQKILLHHNGYASGKENVVTLNDSDKFQSEYRPYHNGVTMDDFGNTRADKYDTSPTAKIIDFLNNVPKAALSPEAELKGKIMIQPKIVTVTTNVKHLLANCFSNEPASILRRFDLVFDVRLKDDYVNPATGGLNSAMVMGQHLPDAWEIDVSEVVIVRSKDPNMADTYEFKVILESASAFEAMEYAKQKSMKHFEFQRQFVQSVEEMYSTELCQHSYMPHSCPLCLKAQSGEESTISQYFDPLEEEEEMFIDIVPAKEQTIREIFEEHYSSTLRAMKISSKSILDAIVEKREFIGKMTLGVFGLTLSVYTIRRLAKCFCAFIPQGANVATPKSNGDPENVWKRVNSIPLPCSVESKTITFEDLDRLVSKHIGHAYLIDKEQQKRCKCNIFPLQGNFWLLPSHMLQDKEYHLEVQTTPRDILGKNFHQVIGPELWYRIPNTDFVVICLTSGGDVPRLSRFLPTMQAYFDGMTLQTVFKDPDGSVDSLSTKSTGMMICNYTGVDRTGFGYQYKKPTFEGLCMTTLITRTKTPVIAGFHLAGLKGYHDSFACSLTQSELNDAIAHLCKKKVNFVHSSGSMPDNKYGISYNVSKHVETSNAVNWLTEQGGCQPVGQVYGSHSLGTRTFRSEVRKSVISDSVKKNLGIPNIHGKPKGMNSWKHWQRDLDLMSHPTGNFRPSIMKAARTDMLVKVGKFLQRNKELLEHVHPYSNDANLAGVDGVNGVDAVNLSTSMGFPINKQKKNFVWESCREVEGITRPLEMDARFWEELERMEECLANGERIHTIFRGNLKDEPTKLTKDKVRVFAGCEFAFTLLVRKYFLSIVRLMQNNWLEFECAVGINAHGKDWSKLTKHIIKYGRERMIAGDYKAYDKKVCPEATLSAFDILIYIADQAGYSERQLTIMRGIATEICLPIYEYNGVFVQVFGSMPSGHPLTVIINNLQNSIYLRYGYYAMHDGEVSIPPFDSVVALVCYGDDNVMGVSEKEHKFNHTSLAAELDKIGIVYTMADKEAESVPFQDLSEVSFLKRGFVYDNDLGQWLAPIEEASITKSLHNYMSRRGSTELPEQISAQAVENAMREYFRFGRETYNERKIQLENVLDECDLRPFCPSLMTYDEAVDDYKDRLKDKKTMVQEPSTVKYW